MTKTEQDIFFALLRSAIWEKPMEMEYLEAKEYSWFEILQTFADHDLLGVVTNAVMRLPEEYRPDEELQQEIMQFCEDLKEMHQLLNRAVAWLFEKLSSKGLTPVLLKGQGLAAIYPETCIRSCGDLDIYVGREGYEKAKKIVNELCSQEQIFNVQEDEHQYHIQLTFEGVDITIELHPIAGYCAVESKQLWYEEWSSFELEKKKCSSVLINNTKILVPNPQFCVSYLFDHLCRHFRFQGIGIRQFVDIVVLIKTNSFDSSVVEDNLWRLGLTQAWKTFSFLFVKDLGVDAELFFLYDDFLSYGSKQFLLNNILSDFRFGSFSKWRHNGEKMPHDIYRIIAQVKKMLKIYRLNYLLFPNVANHSLSLFLYGGLKGLYNRCVN